MLTLSAIGIRLINRCSVQSLGLNSEWQIFWSIDRCSSVRVGCWLEQLVDLLKLLGVGVFSMDWWTCSWEPFELLEGWASEGVAISNNSGSALQERGQSVSVVTVEGWGSEETRSKEAFGDANDSSELSDASFEEVTGCGESTAWKQSLASSVDGVATASFKN